MKRYQTSDILALESLSKVLHDYEISNDRYSFHGYQEDAICFQKLDSKNYVVYQGKNGEEYQLCQFQEIFPACLHFIGRVSPSPDISDGLKKEFEHLYLSHAEKVYRK